MKHLITDWIALPASADGRYVAIADVHGSADLLASMISVLDGELPQDSTIVFLGDLIDRGPASVRSIDLAMGGVGTRPTVALAGNHESMMLTGLLRHGAYHERVHGLWIGNGGDTVARELECDGDERDLIITALGPERMVFLKNMKPNFLAGQVLFAHAGVNPDRELGWQLDAPVMDMDTVLLNHDESLSMRWVRARWVGYDKPLENDLFVVYGHTIQKPGFPLVTRCQAGIDLGAYRRGTLCAADIDGDRMRFVFVGDPKPELARVDDYPRLREQWLTGE